MKIYIMICYNYPKRCSEKSQSLPSVQRKSLRLRPSMPVMPPPVLEMKVEPVDEISEGISERQFEQIEQPWYEFWLKTSKNVFQKPYKSCYFYKWFCKYF